MPHFAVRLRGGLRRFRTDLRTPLPGAEHLSRPKRFTQRARYLASRYGWHLVVIAFLCYLIRDLVLYVLLPYLAAKHLFAD